MPEYFTLVFVAVLGLAFGSFLNVCIYRLPRSESPISPASHCTTCNRTLAWFENIPVVSWLVLRGRCRTCGERISFVYPAIEIAASVITVVWYVFFFDESPVLFVSRLLFAYALVVLFVIDLQHRILPNVITIPGVVVGFVFSFFTEPGWQASLVGLLVGGVGLYMIAEAYYRIRGEEGLGMGDIKMLGMIGAFLGWKLMILTLIVGSLLGSLAGIVMLVTRKGDMKYALPFGTFLAVAALGASLFGDRIVTWYLNFYR